jgi:hypothetical protein
MLFLLKTITNYPIHFLYNNIINTAINIIIYV